MKLFRSITLVTFVCVTGSVGSVFAEQDPLPATPTAPQPPTNIAPAAPPAKPPVAQTTSSDRREGANNQKDWHFIGHVEMDLGNNTMVYAEDARVYTGTNKAVATGNVLFTQGSNRISAERAEFDTETKLGTFYNAWGLSTVQPPRQTPRAGGIAPPPVIGEETIVYFFGAEIEKIGPKKYKITNGGFSTCVQPTPRWDLSAGTVVLNVDHYTLLKNAVLTVKGVPMLYLPILYYPTKRDGRATGFLIPTYGASSLRGQSLHNAFFWAINRSQDATVLHDWYSKTGQGYGGEYRYNVGSGDGNIRTYFDNQHETTYTVDNVVKPQPANQSYEIRGSASQILPGNLRSRASVDYFSDIATSQTFNTNIYDASRNQRRFGANVVGAWGKYAMNATLDHTEYFSTTTNSTLSGSLPRISFTRNERPILDSPAYFSITTEYFKELRVSKSATTTLDTSLDRVDVAPTLRYPFKKWQWFTVNSTLGWRDTFYTRSYSPDGVVIDDPLNRTLYTLQAQIVGPVFNRVWDTPANGYAEKFKHTVEPFITIDRTSAVDDVDRIVKYDGIDQYVGGARYTYGLNNRFYAKRVLTPGTPAISREIFDVEVTQSYYTNQDAAKYDMQYQTSQGASLPSHFSPISLSIRGMPNNDVNATLRAEFDSRYLALRTVSAQGSYSWNTRIQTTAGWSKRAFIEQLPEFNDLKKLNQYLNAATTMHTIDNRVGAVYSFNYDVLNSTMTQQRVSAFYNAQCCGLAVEYQTFNYGALSSSPIPADHRFFLSFTLAGLGNFSPFNGALSGVPR